MSQSDDEEDRLKVTIKTHHPVAHYSIRCCCSCRCRRAEATGRFSPWSCWIYYATASNVTNNENTAQKDSVVYFHP